MATQGKAVHFGPCCFCAEKIEQTDIDPCRVTVSTTTDKWQVWYCHSACFKERLGTLAGAEGFFEPAHF